MERFRLFSYTPAADGRAVVRVDPSQAASFTIDRRVYGNFLEHLGNCIYGGVWAQILSNSSFERDPRVEQDKDPTALPHPWQSFGDARVTADGSARNSQVCARIEGRGAGAGIQQRVYLPTHRESQYKGYVYLRREGDVNQVEVSLCPAEGEPRPFATAELSGVTSEWRRYEFQLEASREHLPPLRPGLFRISFSGPGTVWVDQALLFPEDARNGIDPDIVRVARQWNIPLLRYPGGNFVSGYHWKDGVGPRDDRPSYPNPAWRGMELNQFGTDEFMEFCRLIRTEPHICVNIGNGTPEEAADWVEYCNGGESTEMGRLRARNGHEKPYGVRLWEVGNEIYGSWQIGHCDAEENARRYRSFSQAMLKVDAGLELIANGEAADNDWNPTLIRECGPLLRHISLHPLINLPGHLPSRYSLEEIYYSALAHPQDFEARYLPKLRQMVLEDPRTPDTVKAAVTEWGIIYGEGPFRALDYPHAENQAGAVYSGCFLNGLIRSGEFVQIANITALLHGGGMKKRRQFVYTDPQYWALKLYADSSAHRAVATSVSGPGYSVPRRDFLPEVKDVPYLDAVACLNDGGTELTLFVTNRHHERALEAEVRLEGWEPKQARLQQLAAEMLQRNSEEDPDRVKPTEEALKVGGSDLRHTFPACSVSVLTFRR